MNTDEYGENPHIKIGRGGSIRFKNDWNFQHNTFAFQGGKQGRRGRVHNDFTDAQIFVHKSTDEILGVLYALDNDYLNEWLRQTIDPSIPNNYDELHAEKEFEVLITTTTYTTEKVKVVGRTYDECVKTMKQNDPMLDVSMGWKSQFFSGRKTISKKEGTKPIPSSYEEWVSLNEKEVA